MPTATKSVAASVIDVLSRSTVDGNRLTLPGTLDRPDYVAVDKVLKAIGGKWNRAAKAHIFPGDAAEAIEPVLLTGTVTDERKAYDAFYTPAPVAEQVIDLADIEPGYCVLEPSAGTGALAVAAARRGATVTAIELRHTDWSAHGLKLIAPSALDGDYRRQGTHPDGAVVEPGAIVLYTGVDFMDWPVGSEAFDRVVMNPPFSNQRDMHHVRHAASALVEGGRLVAVMSPAFTFRTSRVAVEFRAWLDDLDHDIVELPEGSFKVSGTGVRTVILTVDVP